MLNKVRFINGNLIKILAALFMLLDHVGLIWGVEILRIIGRLSMPLFAFMIAEGCRYTKNKIDHFAFIFLLGALCQIVYAITNPYEIYLSILFTFSISILIIYALQYFKKCIFNEQGNVCEKILSGLLLITAIIGTYFIHSIKDINGKWFYIDYGFWGSMLPVFASIFDFRGVKLPARAKWLDSYYIKLFCFSIGVILLCLSLSVNQWYKWYSLFALIPLALYSGNKGKLNLKYFFYIFYPLHIAVLYGLNMIL